MRVCRGARCHQHGCRCGCDDVDCCSHFCSESVCWSVLVSFGVLGSEVIFPLPTVLAAAKLWIIPFLVGSFGLFFLIRISLNIFTVNEFSCFRILSVLPLWAVCMVLPCQTSRFAVQKHTFRTAKGNLLRTAVPHAPVWREVVGQERGCILGQKSVIIGFNFGD